MEAGTSFRAITISGAYVRTFFPHWRANLAKRLLLSAIDNTISPPHAVTFETLDHEVANYGYLFQLFSTSVASVRQEDVAELNISLAAQKYSSVKVKLQELHEQKVHLAKFGGGHQEKIELESEIQKLRAIVKSNIGLLNAIQR